MVFVSGRLGQDYPSERVDSASRAFGRRGTRSQNPGSHPADCQRAERKLSGGSNGKKGNWHVRETGRKLNTCLLSLSVYKRPQKVHDGSRVQEIGRESPIQTAEVRGFLGFSGVCHQIWENLYRIW